MRLRPSARVARASTCSAGAASTGCSPARTASPGLSRRAAATARRHVRGSTEAGRRAVSARRATSQRRRARARRGQSAARLGEVRLRGAQRGVAEVERRRVHQQRHHARKVLHHVPVEHLRADWRCSGAAGCARKCSLPCTRQAPAGRRQVGAAAGCHGCSGRSGCCQGTRAPCAGSARSPPRRRALVEVWFQMRTAPSSPGQAARPPARARPRGAAGRGGETGGARACWMKRWKALRRAWRSRRCRWRFRIICSAAPAGGSLNATSSALTTSRCTRARRLVAVQGTPRAFPWEWVAGRVLREKGPGYRIHRSVQETSS